MCQHADKMNQAAYSRDLISFETSALGERVSSPRPNSGKFLMKMPLATNVCRSSS